MIVHDVEQGTQQWLDLHIGIPTCSRFAKLVMPKKRKPSTQRDGLVNQLVAEWMLGQVVNEDLVTQFMQRGLTLEGKARDWYAYENDLDVQQVGFATLDDGTAGGSPDGLIGTEGGLEVKLPSPKVHVAYLRQPGLLVDDYFAQVQGYLWIWERHWWDIIAWNGPAGFPTVTQRVERDEGYIAALTEAVGLVTAEVNEILVRFGYRQAEVRN